MSDDIHSAITAMLEAGEHKAGESPRPRQPVVTISREVGAMGDAVAEHLAERLGVTLYGREIIERVATRMQTDRSSAKALDEAMNQVRNLWLYSLVTGEDLSRDNFRRHLVNVLLSVGRLGGVIVGRGGHLVLANVAQIRIRITGSVEVCARRYAARHDIDEAGARKHVEKTNQERGRFLRDTFEARLDDPTTFDMVINTDRFPGPEPVVDLLLDAMAKVDNGIRV